MPTEAPGLQDVYEPPSLVSQQARRQQKDGWKFEANPLDAPSGSKYQYNEKAGFLHREW